MKKVLILEDEENIRSFVVINLRRAGYEAIEAATGQQALDRIQENPDIGVAILDIDEPWKVKHRSADYIMAPWELYECVGDVPNVVFPCATLQDAETGRIAIYYGCADTCVSMAFCYAEEVVEYVKAHSNKYF